ncbi:MAG: class II fructose-bisphosphate aldolase [Gammaproteobacteria bacterium]|nr:class II fructose-bisphosphate aldolase [Gammaproteobacteria bacterium]
MRANLNQVLLANTQAAIGSFNVLDLDMAQAVANRADHLGLPAIIGIASRHFDVIKAPLLTPSLLAIIDAAEQPIALHLDHAGPDQLDMIRQALELGFTSIMIDGSQLPFAENIAITKQVVELAHSYGAGVEGELGAVAGEEGVADTGSESAEEIPYTQADEAKEFVSHTGIDALAIAVGTAHGIYTQSPHISFETIRDVKSVTDVPLVMHGATGVTDDDIRASVNSGIRKINFFSGLLQCAMDQVRGHNECDNNDYLAFKARQTVAWQDLIEEQMLLYKG